MPTAASIGYGTTLLLGDGATGTEVFTAVAEITSISPPGFSKDAVDGTHMLSAGRSKEFISGLRDAGEIQFEANYSDAAFAALKTVYDLDKARNVRIVFPLTGAQTTTGSKFEASVIMTALGQSDPIGDVRKLTGTFKISGQPTFTAGA